MTDERFERFLFQVREALIPLIQEVEATEEKIPMKDIIDGLVGGAFSLTLGQMKSSADLLVIAELFMRSIQLSAETTLEMWQNQANMN